MPMIFRRILYSFIPLIVVFFAAEMGLRASGWPKITSKFEHNEPFWTVDPDVKNKSFPHKEEDKSFLVSTNSDGLRDSFEVQNKKPGEKTIIALGCSTTFGWGVANNESYPARLQQYIQEAGINNTRVINGGQPGYTSFQGSWLWQEVLKNYEPDVVLIGYVVQDARKAAYTDKSQAILQNDSRYLKDNLLYRSRTYLGLRSLIGSIQIRAKERGQGDVGGVYRVPPTDYVANIRSLVSAIKGGGGEPILFGYPLERSGYTAKHRSILKAAAQQLQLRHFDPQSLMEEASRQQNYYFTRDRGHANAAGNAQIARWVFDFLQREKIVGGGQ